MLGKTSAHSWVIELDPAFRLQLHGAIYRPDSFVLMLSYCANLKAIRYESTRLKRIVADKSHHVIAALTWQSDCCYLNNGECNLNQSVDDTFVERVAKILLNGRPRTTAEAIATATKFMRFSLFNCFVFVITLVWKTVHSSAITQVKAHLMEKNIATCNLMLPSNSRRLRELQRHNNLIWFQYH